MPQGRIHVVGGGLAGMVLARALRRRGRDVTVFDSSPRLGGKAGADTTASGDLLDHGYHVFPGWYRNTRALLDELGVSHLLSDTDRVHYIRKETSPRIFTLKEVSSIGNAIDNFRTGLVPWRTAILATYYGLDLACQPFSRRGFLDRVSANGFLRSRFYAHESVAETHQHFVLQASSIPNYELSAMTARRITSSWFRMPSPFMSILTTDLQTGFIDPLERALRDDGVAIELGARLERIVLGGGRVSSLAFAGGRTLEIGPEDRVVLALPVEATRALVDEEIVIQERGLDPASGATPLSRLFELETAPMAALHVFLKRKLTNLPKEHVVLFASDAQLSFVDVSQWWEGFDTTVLSAIASNYHPLIPASPERAKRQLISEMIGYLHPFFGEADVDWERSHLRPNLDAPLFLNTVGSWPARPTGRTRFGNLFVCGDYCRSSADLTTMESAVESGLRSANHVLASLGSTERVPFTELDDGVPWWIKALRILGLPVVWLLSRF